MLDEAAIDAIVQWPAPEMSSPNICQVVRSNFDIRSNFLPWLGVALQIGATKIPQSVAQCADVLPGVERVTAIVARA